MLSSCHKVGDTFDFYTERGKLCPMANHVAFPYIDIFRYGGSIPGEKDENSCIICCPDVNVINIQIPYTTYPLWVL